jgi:hypothetical protein
MAAGTPSGAMLGGRLAAIGLTLGSERLVLWSPQDDAVLAAIVAEFGFNWSLVADVLRSASAVSGQYRRADMCRVR